MDKILDRISTPADLKGLDANGRAALCAEVRAALLRYLEAFGGHVGSNLGMVEATVALHTVFDAPRDKIVFDVSHQCYAHKILTGRKAAYLDAAQFGSVSGFTNPAESGYDLFSVGHTSTAVSLACGLAKSRDLKGERYNVVAVVGDGALSGGLALEGLNNAAALGSGLILIVNDNDMSIAENHGGLYQNLKLLRDTRGQAPCNLFRALGLDYVFVGDGNDVEAVTAALASVKDTPHPTVVHLCTVKGKGYRPAETDRECWHYRGPFVREDGRLRCPAPPAETYESLTAVYLADKMRRDPTVTAVTAGTPKVLGFERPLRVQFPRQFVDVGIAEPHAVTMITAMAKNGAKPVFGVSSSFLQRTYDQLCHDLALNCSPAVILVFFAGLSEGSQTHMGAFDIAMTRSIPNLIQLAPTCREEYLSMLDWAVEQNEAPVLIRVPGVAAVSRKAELPAGYARPAYEIARHGTEVAVLALGTTFPLGEQVCSALASGYGIHATLINPRSASGIDERVLNSLAGYGHRLVATLEEGVLDGGFGERIARFYGSSPIKVLCFGANKEFVDRTPVKVQYRRCRLTAGQITEDIFRML